MAVGQCGSFRAAQREKVATAGSQSFSKRPSPSGRQAFVRGAGEAFKTQARSDCAEDCSDGCSLPCTLWRLHSGACNLDSHPGSCS